MESCLFSPERLWLVKVCVGFVGFEFLESVLFVDVTSKGEVGDYSLEVCEVVGEIVVEVGALLEVVEDFVDESDVVGHVFDHFDGVLGGGALVGVEFFGFVADVVD